MSTTNTLKTIGQLISEAITLHELNPVIVEQELDFPKGYGIIVKLMNDEYYTNNIPVVLFKNLIQSLHIPFEKIIPAMLPTFKLMVSKETPETIKKKPHGYMLWENEESVLKYTKHLKELMVVEEPKVSEVDVCKHEPLIDTGVGYYYCPACNKGWTKKEWLSQSQPVEEREVEEAELWDEVLDLYYGDDNDKHEVDESFITFLKEQKQFKISKL